MFSVGTEGRLTAVGWFPLLLGGGCHFLGTGCCLALAVFSVLLSPPQIPWGFRRIPQDSSGLPYNFSDFELEENNSGKSSGILRTGTEFG